MKTIYAVLALTLAGVAHAAPTTFYFSGTADLHRVVDASTNTWVDGAAAQSFSGSITVDGRHGTLTSVLGFPAEVQSMQRLTNSQCGVVSNGQCTDEPPAPTNFLGFTLNFGGTTYKSWATGLAGSVEYSSVTKLRYATGSSYIVTGTVGKYQNISTLPTGFYSLFSSVGVGLTLAGDPQAVGDVYDPAQFPDLDRFTPAVSELRFDSSAYTCNEVDGACQDVVFDPDSVVMIGKLNYVGLSPEAVAEVPEPTSAALVLAGALGLVGTRLRMRSRARSS